MVSNTAMTTCPKCLKPSFEKEGNQIWVKGGSFFRMSAIGPVSLLKCGHCGWKDDSPVSTTEPIGVFGYGALSNVEDL